MESEHCVCEGCASRWVLEDGWRGEIASIMRVRARDGLGFSARFCATDCICRALRWLQSLPGSAADCARMHASKQGMRDKSTRRASTVRARDVRHASKQGMRDKSPRRAGNVRGMGSGFQPKGGGCHFLGSAERGCQFLGTEVYNCQETARWPGFRHLTVLISPP